MGMGDRIREDRETGKVVNRMNKYGAKKLIIDGETFDSRMEARRWRELRLIQRAGEIDGLQRQVKYVLIPAQRDGTGHVIERPVSYIADFVYRDARTGEQVVEDVKGARTKEYIIKRKLMMWVHGIRIKEVRA